MGLLAVLGVASAQAQPAANSPTDSGRGAPVCIRPFDAPRGNLDHTHVVDRQTILFYMRDGKVWKNTLRTPCMGLLFHGFEFVTHQDEVCSNAQSIRVITTGEVCQLGPFTPYTPPA
jgi:hypothetical protein